jgi:hypothetical protein
MYLINGKNVCIGKRMELSLDIDSEYHLIFKYEMIISNINMKMKIMLQVQMYLTKIIRN